MSRGLNQVLLIGRVGQDCEVTTTKNGVTVCNFSLATGVMTKDATQQSGYREKTSWHQIVAFQQTAEIISKFAKKGAHLYIQGTIDYNKFEKDGVTRHVTKIIVKEFLVLSSEGHEAAPQQVTHKNTTTDADFDDPIPF